MRSNVDSQKIEQLMEALGKEARSSGCIYFTGGASALLIGWRSSTVDNDNHSFIKKGNPYCVRLSDFLFPNSQAFSQLLMAKDAIFDLMDGA